MRCYCILLERSFPDVSVVCGWHQDNISSTNTRTLIGHLYNHSSKVAAIDPGQGRDPKVESPIFAFSVSIL